MVDSSTSTISNKKAFNLVHEKEYDLLNTFINAQGERVILRFYTSTTQNYMSGGQLLLGEERALIEAEKPPTVRKSTAKLSHIANTGPRQARFSIFQR